MRWMHEVKLNAKFTSTEITRSSGITLRLNLKICCLSLERPTSSAFLLFTKRRMLLHERLTKAGFTLLLNSCPKSIKIKYEPETLFDTRYNTKRNLYFYVRRKKHKAMTQIGLMLPYVTLSLDLERAKKNIYSKLTINWLLQKYRSYLNNLL